MEKNEKYRAHSFHLKQWVKYPAPPTIVWVRMLWALREHANAKKTMLAQLPWHFDPCNKWVLSFIFTKINYPVPKTAEVERFAGC